MSLPPTSSLEQYFGELLDPREGQNIQPPLLSILGIAICAVICGADNWVNVEMFGQAKQGWLETFLDLPHGIPSHDTFGREMFQERLERKIPDVPTFSLNHLRLLTLTVCEFLGEFIGHCAPSSHNNDQAMMVLQVRATLYDVVLAWVKESARHRLPSNLSPEAVAKVTSWVIFGVVMEWSQNGRKQTPQQLTEEVLSLLVGGLKAYLL